MLDDLNVLKGGFKMEVNFEKRYTLIYVLILAVSSYLITKFDSILMFRNFLTTMVSLDGIVLVITLILLSLFTREQKERIAFATVFKKQSPFENSAKYVKNDRRIDMAVVKNMGLENISNDMFYNKYYYPVRDNLLVKNKNAEFCIIRDIVFVLFIIMIIMFIFTMIWHNNFVVEFIVSVASYVIGVVACHKKVGDFIRQIIVEYINKEDK